MNLPDKDTLFSNNSVEKLMMLIKPYLSEKRYSHTLCVMKEAELIGNIYLPDKVNKLKIAALLHDITKRADFEKQLQYLREFDIIIDSDLIDSPEILHAVTARAVASRDFYDYVDDEILSAIENHTTGGENMTVFDSIINLADYIEESRQYDSCKKVRNYFYNKLYAGEDKILVLYDTMILMFDTTISYLTNKGLPVNKNTIAARDYFVSLMANHNETRGFI